MGNEQEQHEKLIELMYRWDSDLAEVAKVLEVKRSTVKQWRTRRGSNISNNNLDLLEFKLGELRTHPNK